MLLRLRSNASRTLWVEKAGGVITSRLLFGNDGQFLFQNGASVAKFSILSSGGLNVFGDILLSVGDVFDIGSMFTPFQTGYFGTSVDVGVGNSKDGEVEFHNDGSLFGAELRGDWFGSESVIRSDGDFLPNADNTHDLGKLTAEWKQVAAVDLNISGISTLNGNAVFGGNVDLGTDCNPAAPVVPCSVKFVNPGSVGTPTERFGTAYGQALDITNNATVGGNLSVTGTSTLGGALTANALATFNSGWTYRRVISKSTTTSFLGRGLSITRVTATSISVSRVRT